MEHLTPGNEVTMVEDYAKSVIDAVRNTANNKSGMNQIVDDAEKAITAVDQDVAELLTQRTSLVTIHQQYVTLYEILLGEELRTRQQVQQVAAMGRGLAQTEKVRARVLEIAGDLETHTSVSEAKIVRQLQSEFKTLPWRNPNAVVATILTRSGAWQKMDAGNYEPLEDEDEGATT